MYAPQRCLFCERELNWFARLIHGRFCSTACETQYREKMTSLAVERLNTTRVMTEPDNRPSNAE